MGDRWKRLVGTGVAAIVVAATPLMAGAQEGDGGHDRVETASEPKAVAPATYTAHEYLAIWDDAALPGVIDVDPSVLVVFGAITGDAELDARIRELAAARGYEIQPVSRTGLVAVDGRRLQPVAADAWVALKAAARADGVRLVLTSAHRDLREQRAVFLDRLVGRTDAALEATLRFSAPPGYSRHHTGYTVDVGEAGSGRGDFGGTRAYAWLAADDFAVARSLGWIPSYPEDGVDMGPDPEPWELVWVGSGRINCARAVSHPSGFCDVANSPHRDAISWLVDRGITVGCRPGRFCVDDPITRGEAAALLWRLHGAPPTEQVAPFLDVFARDPFAPAVNWLWSEGLAHGMTPVSFGPDEPLVPADALALFVRLSARDGLPAPSGLVGTGAPPVVAPQPAPGDFISRGAFASVLAAFAGS